MSVRTRNAVALVAAWAALTACTSVSGGSPTAQDEQPASRDGGSSSATGTASAGPAPCGSKQLDVTTAAVQSQQMGVELFEIRFTAKAGATCTLVGAPDDLIFQKGTSPLGVDQAPDGPEPAESVVVTADSPKAVYVSAPSPEEAGAQASRVTFTLPGGNGDAVTVAWPGDVNGPVRASRVGDVVG
ncbi:DUF4232 domain-containing protein [Umezawaea beigongshangensis]|uniref:DUF4232 domain-containing protein n=1 Tax=Umezawaea beigongshangensis TaxID=2780383 RepID=UPI0018F20076|nr:DUF4232 domain-containing protein [Umezawaea beigongshangensis]